MKQTASLNSKTHVALETLLLFESYYYFSIRSQKYRACEREQNRENCWVSRKNAGFKEEHFPSL